MSDSVWQTAKAPEFVETNMPGYLKEGEAAKNYKADFPLGRFATSENIVNVYLFLSCNMGNPITGQVISACGGLNI